MAKFTDPTSFLMATATSSKPKTPQRTDVITVTPSLPKKATRKQIAEHFDISPSTVSRRLKAGNYSVGRGGKIDTTTAKFDRAFEGLENKDFKLMTPVDLPEEATLTDLTKTYKASSKDIKQELIKYDLLKEKGAKYTKAEYEPILGHLQRRLRELTKEEIDTGIREDKLFIHYLDLLTIMGYQSFNELYKANSQLFHELLTDGPYAGNQTVASLSWVLEIIPQQYHEEVKKKGV